MTIEEFLRDWNNESARLLVHTSGSTGKPKPLWIEKSRMVASAQTTCDFLGLKENDTALLCMSLDYIAGKMMAVRAIVRNLRLVCVEPSGNPLSQPVCKVMHKGNVEIIKNPQEWTDCSIDFAAMVPMQVYNSLQSPADSERLRNIKHLIIGGGAIDESLSRVLLGFPNAVWSTYGMTETLSHIALRHLNGKEATEWYTPLPGAAISQTDEGCMVIDAPAVCPERLVTNDIVEIVCNDVPRFRILGRKDNVICSGGIKIQIEEVERAIKPFLSMPFLITKRHDAKFGEIVVMLAETPTTESTLEASEKKMNTAKSIASTKALLKDICQQHLPKYWQPRDYIFTDKIPTTETGKPARSKAEELAGKEM